MKIHTELAKKEVTASILVFDNGMTSVAYASHKSRLELINAATIEMNALDMDNRTKAESITNKRNIPYSHFESKDYIG